jgi:hypothetical protein
MMFGLIYSLQLLSATSILPFFAVPTKRNELAILAPSDG